MALNWADQSDDEGSSYESDSDASYVSSTPSVLPEHACAYCGLHETSCVAKCTTCRRWFCNAKVPGSGSHMVQHLVRSKHKEVSLHPDSLVGDSVLECYNCGCRNIFILGFISADGDSTVVLLCRQPCAVSASGRDSGWNIESWQPLISDRALLHWLVNVPEGEALLKSRPVSQAEIVQLEEAWKTNPQATLASIAAARTDEELGRTQLRYEHAFQYQSILAPLVTVEADYDRTLKESQRQSGISVRWDQALNGRHLACFALPNPENLRITVGDEVKISCDTPREWSAVGVVIRTPSGASEEMAVEVRSFKSPPESSQTSAFTIEFLWKSVSYDRMHWALRKFAVDEINPHVLGRILGQDESDTMPNLSIRLPDHITAPGLPDLNHSQAHAVRSALSRPLSLIQGPPGTGKTVTSATIVYHLASVEQGPILVTAPSNVAVDHLTEKIHLTGLRVVRISPRWREDMETAVSFLSLHEQIRHVEGRPELKKLMRLREAQGELSAKDEDRFLNLRAQAERELLKRAQVICTTSVGAGSHLLNGINFRAVLIDEATQACEPEALIPIVRNAAQVIMIGDHRQLGPVILSKRAVKAGLAESLFERLIRLGQRPCRLQVQYRMHPCLSEFPSNMFYDGSLQNGVTSGERTRPQLDFPWPDPSQPMLFLSCLGLEEISSSGTSFLNRVEAGHVEKAVTMLLKSAILPSQIGVITPYEGQRAFIVQHMQLMGSLRKELYAEIEVASVDAFQGREMDYIILSCVRSNDHQGIGFLADARRLNVALTRAKYGLIVLGNPKVLSRNPLWHHLLHHFKEKGLLMEGTLANLRPTSLQLSRPRPLTQLAERLQEMKLGADTPSFSPFSPLELFSPSQFDDARSEAPSLISKLED